MWNKNCTWAAHPPWSYYETDSAPPRGKQWKINTIGWNKRQQIITSQMIGQIYTNILTNYSIIGKWIFDHKSYGSWIDAEHNSWLVFPLLCFKQDFY